MFRTRHALPGAVAALLLQAPILGAQTYEQAGTRALGLAGAFVAVADDATAVWWNPAGLATGPFFNVILERHVRSREPADAVADLEQSAIDHSLTGFAIATPPIGLSYSRTRYTFVPAASEDGPGSPTTVSSLVVHQTGVTILQSLTTGLVVGSTLKFVRGIVSGGEVTGGDTGEVLEAAIDVLGRATNRGDIDLGVHWTAGRVRAGLGVRNVFEPSFTGLDGQEVVLERQVRAGVALALRDATTLAADFDLTEQAEDPSGRRLAVGIEQRWHPRFALRAGMRVVTGDETAPVGSVGGSIALRSGIWLDGFWSAGRFEELRWGIGTRVVY